MNSSDEQDLFDTACRIFLGLPIAQKLVALQAMEYIRGNLSDAPPFSMRTQRCVVLL